LFKAGRQCDEAELRKGGTPPINLTNDVLQFIRNYHRMILAIERVTGSFPYDLYPHHLYVPLNESSEFKELDKRKIKSYIYRQETVCLSFENDHLVRRVFATAERKIDVGSN
jgi:hypothetical protein